MDITIAYEDSDTRKWVEELLGARPMWFFKRVEQMLALWYDLPFLSDGVHIRMISEIGGMRGFVLQYLIPEMKIRIGADFVVTTIHEFIHLHLFGYAHRRYTHNEPESWNTARKEEDNLIEFASLELFSRWRDKPIINPQFRLFK